MFVLTINSDDPLKDLRESNDRNRDNLMRQRILTMHLDWPWYMRYWSWLQGISKCFIGRCDFGQNRSGLSVNVLLGNAAFSTLRLVLLSVVLSIVFGIMFGMLTAIRQYSGFDYGVTFIAFVLYSLPAFVFAVLLKEYGAIRFNDWLNHPEVSWVMSLIIGAVIAVMIQAMLAGDIKRRLITAGITFAVTVGMLQFFSMTGWFLHPVTGWWMQVIVGLGAAVLFTSLFTGISNRRVMLVAVISAAVASIVTLILDLTGSLKNPTWLFIIGIALLVAIVCAVIGYYGGGYAKRSALWVCFWTSLSVFFAMVCDFLLRSWALYLKVVGYRPISTIGSETPNFRGAGMFWLENIDNLTHILLPTISLTLMSLAAYTRYTRSSMLDVLGQDYVRTARAKGLPERMVITRHAFRNAMIPITTIVAFDFAGLIGGAVITETVFGWKGMGDMFKVGLIQVDPAPVMAFFLVTGSAAVLMNMIADILYAYIDPRIRR